jgi:hypothetical protein
MFCWHLPTVTFAVQRGWLCWPPRNWLPDDERNKCKALGRPAGAFSRRSVLTATLEQASCATSIEVKEFANSVTDRGQSRSPQL